MFEFRQPGFEMSRISGGSRSDVNAFVAAKLAENYYALYVQSILKYAKYGDMEGTRRDIRKALKAFPGLKPVLNTYFFNDGSEKPLVALEGTIPVNYVGTKYNIPIIVWLLDKHPWRSPKVFLQPTPEMRIKPSQFVNANGKVRFAWKKSWNPGATNIRTMLYDLVEIFEHKPPLYSIH